MSQIIYYSIPIFLVSIALELLYERAKKLDLYERRDSFACLAMGLGNVVIAAAAKTVTFVPLFWLYELAPYKFAPDAWWSWAVLLVAEDFCYYWFHRCHHEVRFMWAAHVNHHSSERYNFAVALRQSWTTPLTGFVFWLPLALMGFHPLMILTQQAVSLLYQFWLHTQAIDRMGPLERVLNTPSHHRVHHGTNRQYLDRNYGGILIVWDRLFGSFEPEGEKVRFGLTHNLGTFNPWRIAFHEWAEILRELRTARSPRALYHALLESPAHRAERLAAQATPDPSGTRSGAVPA